MPQSILTGLQPSGRAHIGNYFGAIEPAIHLAHSYEKSIIFIADLHSLTTLQNKKLLNEYIFDLALTYLACGLDPEKTLIFMQSDVPAHTELSWILSTLTPVAMLERATSYKDKKNKGLDTNAGLFTYPILMASDILLYSPDLVPVGKDQKQHLEIARDLATKFNSIYGGSTLKLPDPVISEETGIILGIDGQKMSKSYGNTIPLFGTKKEIRKTIMQIVTDSKEVSEKKDPKNCNIFTLAQFFLSSEELSLLEKKYISGGMGYGEAKQILWEGVEKKFTPFWERRAELEKSPEKIYKILEDGAKKANSIANRQLEKVKKRVGLV